MCTLMKNEDLISIIIPVYNMSKYIKDCLVSIIEQDYSNIEIIIIDDGSTDDSLQVCKTYMKKDRRIQVFTETNNGVSCARNFGVSIAKGKWIIFVDPDDVCEKNMCSSLLKAAQGVDADIVFGRYTVLTAGECSESKETIDRSCFLGNDINIVQLNLFSHFFANSKKIYRGPFTICGTPWAKLYRRDLLVLHNVTFPEGLHPNEDEIFMLYALENASTVVCTSDKVYKYNARMGTSTRIFDKDWKSHINEFHLLYKSFCSINNKDDRFDINYNYIKIRSLCFLLRYECIGIIENKIVFNRYKFMELVTSKEYNTALKNVELRNMESHHRVVVLLIRLRLYCLLELIIEKHMKREIKSMNKR